MFNDFPDEVTHSRKVGEDSFGNPKYEDSTVSVKKCRVERNFKQTNNSVVTVYNVIFHTPLDLNIDTNDKLDGYRVDNVTPIRGVDNKYHYKRVICE